MCKERESVMPCGLPGAEAKMRSKRPCFTPPHFVIISLFILFLTGCGAKTTDTTSDTTVPSNTTASNFISSGASSTSSTTVTLAISATDSVGVTGYYASETSTAPSAASGWISVTSTTSYSANVSFTLSSGYAAKTVYVWFKDAAGNVSSVTSDTITLSTSGTGTSIGTAFPIANTSLREMSAGTAFDGTNFLVGIEGDATSPDSITAQLVSKTGTLVGPRISTGGLGGAPWVAFDGTNYLLAWAEDATYSTAIFGQLVSTSGALVGTQFTIASGYNNVKSSTPIIFDGTNYFVAWHNESTPGQGDTTDVYGQFVTPGGALLGSVIPISTAAHGQRKPSVAFDGANILAVWADGRNQSACYTDGTGTHCYESDIYGQFITKSGASAGTLSGSNFLIDAGTLPRDNPAGIAFDGTNYLITFVEETTLPNTCPSSGCNWEAYGILVSKTGAPSGSKFVIGNTTTGVKMFPAPTYLGTQYLVTWTDGMGTTSASLKGQYVTTSGAVSGSEFTLFSPASSGAVPWLSRVFTGGGVNLAVTSWGIPDVTDPSNMNLYTSADVMGSIITTP